MPTGFLSELGKQAGTSKNERIKLKKITEYMEMLQKYGTQAGEPYVKHIEDDIWELRPVNDRILFFYWHKNIFVMLHHFTKKTRKTPKREVQQAKRNQRDYMERGGHDESENG